MSKILEQALILEPSDNLRFPGPFSEVGKVDLKLSNPTERKVCFKTKTTSPNEYLVRPKLGIIDQNASVTLEVMKKKTSGPDTGKKKQKLMVQSMFVPDNSLASAEDLWMEADQNLVMESTLCVLDCPVSSAEVVMDLPTESAPTTGKQPLTTVPSRELRFRGPFTEVVTTMLAVSNPTEKRVCFKLLNTSPSRYCVRPKLGILDPKGSLDLPIMLQPSAYDVLNKSKDKFMLRTMIVPDNNFSDAETLWSDADPAHWMESIFRCIFEMPESSKPAWGIEEELRKSREECKRLTAQLEKVQTENEKLKKRIPDGEQPTRGRLKWWKLCSGKGGH